MSHELIAGLRLHHFQPLVGTHIGIDFGAGPLASEVLSARALESNSLREGGGFSVMLRAAVAQPRQGLYAVDIPEVGRCELLLCPRRLDGDAAIFELLFN